jgi:hypothetical protein
MSSFVVFEGFLKERQIVGFIESEIGFILKIVELNKGAGYSLFRVPLCRHHVQRISCIQDRIELVAIHEVNDQVATGLQPVKCILEKL